MKSPPVKQHWVDKCIEIYNYHVSQLKHEPNWTVEKTAQTLFRSIGSVSQALLVASWLRTHEKQLRRFRSERDALDFIKAKKREMKTQELNL